MALIRQKVITREDLRANPNCLYLFGDNAARWGKGGQAKEMRGERNAHGICTKWEPSDRDRAYFSDKDYKRIKKILMSDFERPKKWIARGKTVVVPIDGIGTGLAKLPKKAPKVFALIEELIESLE